MAIHQAIKQYLPELEDDFISIGDRRELDGLEKGLEQGLEKGCLAGRLEVLNRQLERKCGPLSDETRARLSQGSPEDIDRWTDRILEADSLEALFA